MAGGCRCKPSGVPRCAPDGAIQHAMLRSQLKTHGTGLKADVNGSTFYMRSKHGRNPISSDASITDVDACI